MSSNPFLEPYPSFRPFGHRPPFDLTQHLPGEKHATILAVTNRDISNILHTIHYNQSRSLDFTFCEYDSDVLARNILTLAVLCSDALPHLASMMSKSPRFQEPSFTKYEFIWSIYYSRYLSANHRQCLHEVAKVLLEQAESLGKWNATWQKAPVIQFHIVNSDTLARVARVWRSYLFEDANSKANLKLQLKMQAEEKLNIEVMADPVNRSHYLSNALLSLSPIIADKMEIIDAVRQVQLEYLATGIFSANPVVSSHIRATGFAAMNPKGSPAQRELPNPMMCSINPQNSLYPLTDPLLNFHLAPLYEFLQDFTQTPYDRHEFIEVNYLFSRSHKPVDRIVELAQREFYGWVASLQSYLKNTKVNDAKFHKPPTAKHLTFRFFAGDISPFSVALQVARQEREVYRKDHAERTAHAPPSKDKSSVGGNKTGLDTPASTKPIAIGFYVEQGSFTPLVLDSREYSPAAANPAPLLFNVIETSRHVDRVGMMALLTMLSPLLDGVDPTSTLFTETAIEQRMPDSSLERLLFPGPLPTISSLLGLFPIDYYTITSPISLDNSFLADSMKDGSLGPTKRFCRTAWRRPFFPLITTEVDPYVPNTIYKLPRLAFQASELADMLDTLYEFMFETEELYCCRTLSGGLKDMADSMSIFTPKYHRGHFALFLKLVKQRVDAAAWDEAMEGLLSLIRRRTNLPLRTMAYEELIHLLRVYGVYADDTTTILPRENVQECDSLLRNFFRKWPNVPNTVVLTMRIYRKDIPAAVQKKLVADRLTCPVQMILENGYIGSKNHFTACHIGWGRVQTSGKRNEDDYKLEITPDTSAWLGSDSESQLFVSARVPSMVLLFLMRESAVAFSFRVDADTSDDFGDLLDHHTLKICKFPLLNGNTINEKFYLTRDMPNSLPAPQIPMFHPLDLAEPEETGGNPNCRTKISVQYKKGVYHMIMGFRASIVVHPSADQYQSVLTGKPVTVSHLSPCTIQVKVQGCDYALRVDFPLPVDATNPTVVIHKIPVVEIRIKVPKVQLVGTSWTNVALKPTPLLVDTTPGYNQEGERVLAAAMPTPYPFYLPYVHLDALPVLRDVYVRDRLKDSSWMRALVDSMDCRPTPSTEPELSYDASQEYQSEETRWAEMQDTGFQMVNSVRRLLRQLFELYCDAKPASMFVLTKAGQKMGSILMYISRMRLDLNNQSLVLDAFVVNNPMLKKEYSSDPSKNGTVIVYTTAEALRGFRKLLPAMEERCRRAGLGDHSWQHDPETCYYLRDRSVDQPSIFCGCGKGLCMDDDYIQDDCPFFSERYLRLAHRVAISLVFPSHLRPYCPPTEQLRERASTDHPLTHMSVAYDTVNMHLVGQTISSKTRPALLKRLGFCRVCQKTQTAEGKALLLCSKCNEAEYCSRECQKTDWRQHKGQCQSTLAL